MVMLQFAPRHQPAWSKNIMASNPALAFVTTDKTEFCVTRLLIHLHNPGGLQSVNLPPQAGRSEIHYGLEPHSVR